MPPRRRFGGSMLLLPLIFLLTAHQLLWSGPASAPNARDEPVSITNIQQLQSSRVPSHADEGESPSIIVEGLEDSSLQGSSKNNNHHINRTAGATTSAVVAEATDTETDTTASPHHPARPSKISCVDVQPSGTYFVYVPDSMAAHGICSQVQNYILAWHVAATLGRTLVVLPPPDQCQRQAGLYTLFDLPLPCDYYDDDSSPPNGNEFHDSGVSSSSSSNNKNASWTSAQMCRRPEKGGTSAAYTRADFVAAIGASENAFAELPCDSTLSSTNNSKQVHTIIVDGGKKLRRHYVKQFEPWERLAFVDWASVSRRLLLPQQPSPQQQQQQQEPSLDHNQQRILAWFDRHALHGSPSDPLQFRIRLYQGLAALVAPRLSWKEPLLLAPQGESDEDNGNNGNGDDHPAVPRGNYSALHIRRGDKLIKEAQQLVRTYWNSVGASGKQLTNYIPLQAYVDKLIPHVDPPDVYIATDDPVTVARELAALQALGQHNSTNQTQQLQHASYWKFHWLPHRAPQQHTNQQLDNCTAAQLLQRDVAADLQVLQHASVLVAEVNSNWGRVLQTLRMHWNGDWTRPVRRDFRVVFGRNETRYLGV